MIFTKQGRRQRSLYIAYSDFDSKQKLRLTATNVYLQLNVLSRSKKENNTTHWDNAMQ